MVSKQTQTQTQLTIPGKDPFDSRVEGAFGASVNQTPPGIQLEFNKELMNKINWVLGSAYKKKYSGKGSLVAEYSRRVVKAIIRDHGYQI